ncbi:LysR family transcriptional regulator [Oleiagrimonas sp. C23AA]|uniref:LysR family transcriptional regulator n=1 Tax=Oleiagrimonas sp. C23AA TaxID=2719047 RepID=UPI0014204ED8|nr:LysR family transcriptional regulator [Oleiagrimonas sp. C23AA]NII10531.1 LysR family transcriptional regulator [Oleiagrimonas sp. C23AA]
MATPTLSELRAFRTAAVTKSFRAAAEQLGVSPSAFSHAIAGLERQLGVRLFNRTTRSVALTEAGRQFLLRIEPALDALGEAVESVNRHRDTPAGVLRINASEGGAQRLMPWVTGFMARYPDMQVELAADGRLVDIVAEGFDAGVRTPDTIAQDMIALPLGLPERYAVVASPGYAAQHGLPDTPQALHQHTCIRVRLPSGVLFPWEFERQGQTIRVDPPSRLRVGAPSLAMDAALAGHGVAYLIERSIARPLADGALVSCLEDWSPPFAGVALYYPRQRLQSAGLRAFIDYLKEHPAIESAASTPHA